MRREFFKFRKQSVFWATIILLSITLCASVVLYSTQITRDGNIADYMISKYESKEELAGKLTMTNEIIEKLDTSAFSYKNDKAVLEEQKSIYEHLLNNYAPYKEITAVSIAGGGKYDDWFSYFINQNYIIVIAMLFLSAVLSIYFLSYDFLIGTYKNLYTGIRGRKNIIASKFFVYILIVTAYYFVLYAIAACFGAEITKDSEINTMLAITTQGVKSYNSLEYIIINCLSYYVFILLYAILFFAIGLIFRNMLLCLIADVATFAVPTIILIISENSWVNAIFMDIFSSVNSDYVTIVNMLVGLLVKLALLTILGIIAIKYFLKKDLT